MIQLNLTSVLALLILMTGLSFSSCSKDEDTEPEVVLEQPPENTIPEDVLYYFTGMVDGVETKIYASLENENNLYHSNGGSIGTSECTYDYGASIGNQDLETPPFFWFDLYGFYDGFCARELEMFNTVIPVGNIVYAANSDVTEPRSVVVGFQTADGIYTSLNPANQQNSNFTIVVSHAENNSLGKYQMLEGRVSCTLFKEDDPTQTIRIQQGIFRMDIAAYNN